MRLCISGSRGIAETKAAEIVYNYVTTNPITSVNVGDARGVDSAAKLVCNELAIATTIHKADWHKHGRGAGFVRNFEMSLESDKLLAIWDGKSPGTKHMIQIMEKANKPVEVIYVD